MKIPKTRKILGVCSKVQDSRFSTEQPYTRGGDLIATDGRALVCFQGGAEGLPDASLPRALVEHAQKGGHDITVEDGNASAGGLTLPLGTRDTPDHRQVLPDYSGQHTVRVALDANLLAALAKALDAPGDRAAQKVVILEMVENTDKHYGKVVSPIRVTVSNDPNTVGVIMPCTIKD